MAAAEIIDVPESVEYAQHEPWIHTRTGRFYIAQPSFDAQAIGPALGQLARYNGHGAFFYSVAEHCLLVERIMRNEQLGDPFEGLMHDAAEAYLRDISSPWKQLLPDSVALENRVEALLRVAYGLPPDKSPGCNKADKLALFMEAWVLMPDKGEGFTDVLGVRNEALKMRQQYYIAGHDWHDAGRYWLRNFYRHRPEAYRG